LEEKEKKKRKGRKGKKRRKGRKRPNSKSFMSIKNTTFKYEEYELEVDGAHSDVVIIVNTNEEIEIIKCQVHV